MIGKIDVQPFMKARKTFEDYRKHLKSEQEKSGAIQAFEFSYELAWKTMKRMLSQKGIDARSPRDCFREAATIGMISNPKAWFQFIEMRNVTVHAYDEEIVNKVLMIFDDFSTALSELMEYLENERKKSIGD